MIYTFRLDPQPGRPKPYYFHMILQLLGLKSHLIFAFCEVGGKPINYSQDYRLVQRHECATHLVLDEITDYSSCSLSWSHFPGKTSRIFVIVTITEHRCPVL
ncbi:unnamed protein product [Pipistrellus nathusii]|uniref:Uncharacterized protein n=1 Tax=Pipistrellus nathusii TaxID=59473 RepID=A0ABN9Z400_PIPNA